MFPFSDYQWMYLVACGIVGCGTYVTVRSASFAFGYSNYYSPTSPQVWLRTMFIGLGEFCFGVGALYCVFGLIGILLPFASATILVPIWKKLGHLTFLSIVIVVVEQIIIAAIVVPIFQR